MNVKKIAACLSILIAMNVNATPLCNAVKENDLVKVSALLENGAAVNQRNALGYTPLMLAAGLGNYQMTDLLLAAGADVYMLDTRMGSTALHKAAQSGVVPVADLLIKHGAFLDLVSATNGNTPLYDAVWHRNPSMVRYLLEEGANWEMKARGVFSPLDLARNNGDKHIVLIIEDHIKKADDYRKSDKIFKAVEDNDTVLIKKMAGDGFDINAKAEFTMGNAPKGATPLLYAAQLGREEVIKVLLEEGANPRIVDWIMKSTVLHKSGYNGKEKNIKMLVSADSELNAQGPYNGYTALHDAVWHGHYETAKALLENGARYDLKGLDGNTPLDLAVKYGYKDIAELLKSYGK